MSITVLLFAVTAAGAEETGSEPVQKKRGRPEHVADFSAAGYPGQSDQWDLKCTLSDKLFTIGDSLPVYNTVKADCYRTGDVDNVPARLYMISESVSAQSDRYAFLTLVSSAGDQPFHRMDDTTIMGAASMQVWQDGGHSISAAVFFSNMDIYGWYIPIPFVNYAYKSASLTVLAGIPTMLFWKIRSDLQFTFSYFPTLNIESTLLYKPLPFISIGPELAVKQDRYSIENRKDREEHLFHRYIYAGLTAQSYVSSFAGIYISAGVIPYNVYFRSRKSWDQASEDKGAAEFTCRIGIKLFAR